MYALHTPSLRQKQETAIPLSPVSGLELDVAVLCDFLSLGALRDISVTFIRRARQFISGWHRDICHDLQGFDVLENSLSLYIELMFGTVKKENDIAIHFSLHFPASIQIPTSQ